MTSNTKRSLNIIDVKSPCDESWGQMTPTGPGQRNCELCSQAVYNLSEMTKVEAEALVFESTGRVCVRFFRRMDGTVVTSDCSPVRFRHLRQAGQGGLRIAAKVIGAVVAVLSVLGFARFIGFSPFGRTQGEIAVQGAMTPEPQTPEPVIWEPLEAELGEVEYGYPEDHTPQEQSGPENTDLAL